MSRLPKKKPVSAKSLKARENCFIQLVRFHEDDRPLFLLCFDSSVQDSLSLLNVDHMCHQIRITGKCYCFKGLGMDMRHLILKNFISESTIFNKHLKFLCLGSKSLQNFNFVSNLNWSCSKCIKISGEPSIFNRHLKFLCLGSKSVQIFHFILNLNWGCSKWVQIALFASWNNSDFHCLFWLAVWFHAFSTIIVLSASWKLLELLYIGFEH